MRQEDNPQIYYRGKRVIDEIDEWYHGLGKQIALQRQEYGLVLRKELPKVVDPNEFMEHDKVHSQLCIYKMFIAFIILTTGKSKAVTVNY